MDNILGYENTHKKDLTKRYILAAKTYVGIEIAEEADWTKLIEGSTAVVNLAGAPISTRWSPEVSLFSTL